MTFGAGNTTQASLIVPSYDDWWRHNLERSKPEHEALPDPVIWLWWRPILWNRGDPYRCNRRRRGGAGEPRQPAAPAELPAVMEEGQPVRVKPCVGVLQTMGPRLGQGTSAHGPLRGIQP
jgi:hypothetical protein